MDSKKSTSFAVESEAFIEYGQKEEDDAVSIHEGDDLVMKLKTIDETTEGQGQGDNEVDKPVCCMVDIRHETHFIIQYVRNHCDVRSVFIT